MGFADKYILQLAAETARIAPVMLYKIVYSRLSAKNGTPNDGADERTGKTAAAVTNKVLSNRPSNETGVAFLRDNLSEVIETARSLSDDRTLCTVLSGSAYILAYGRFLSSGGKRGFIMNPFLGFVRALSQSYSASGEQAMEAYETWRRYQDALGTQRDSVEPLLTLHELGLFVPLEHNPNEKAYFEAVVQCLKQLESVQPVA